MYPGGSSRAVRSTFRGVLYIEHAFPLMYVRSLGTVTCAYHCRNSPRGAGGSSVPCRRGRVRSGQTEFERAGGGSRAVRSAVSGVRYIEQVSPSNGKLLTSVLVCQLLQERSPRCWWLRSTLLARSSSEWSNRVRESERERGMRLARFPVVRLAPDNLCRNSSRDGPHTHPDTNTITNTSTH